MFTPDSPPHPAADSQPADNTTKKLADKKVVYSNTRLLPVSTEPERPPSPTNSFIDAAIAGFPRGAPATPRVRGYSFVTDTAPAPPPSPPKEVKTAFRIAATPRREEVLHRMVEKVAKGKRDGTANSPAVLGKGSPAVAAPPTARRTLLGGGGKGREVPKFVSSPAVTPAGQRLWGALRKGRGREEVSRNEKWTPTPRAKR